MHDETTAGHPESAGWEDHVVFMIIMIWMGVVSEPVDVVRRVSATVGMRSLTVDRLAVRVAASYSRGTTLPRWF